MSRIRTVKPEFWTDDLICSLKLAERLLFIASWNLADDEGRLIWAGAQLKGAVFSTDDDITIADVEAMMRSLERAELIVAYVGGRSKQRLGFIRNFKKHQKINRPQPSRHPAPPSEPAQTSTESIPSEPNQAGVNGSLNDSVNGSVNDSVTEGKGKGREGKIGQVLSHLPVETPGNPKPEQPGSAGNVIELPLGDFAERERAVFKRGREVLGPNSGGLVAKLWSAVAKDPDRAMKAIEMAAAKFDCREWLAGQINTMTQARAGPPAEPRKNPRLAAADQLLVQLNERSR